jgi:hypothetical protein
MHKSLSTTALAAIVTLGATAFAQSDRTMVVRGDDFQSAGAIHLELDGMDDHKPPVKGIPLTADIVNTHVQVLQDGNKITNEETSHFYRDSEGRTRRENTLVLAGHEGDAPTMIMINDPVAHSRFVLNTKRKEADEMPGPGGPGGPDVMFMKKHADEQIVTTGGTRSAPEGKETMEDLGTQSIEGVTAHGTRSTHVIPAGQIGNEKPITVTTESWYSDELGMEVLRVHKDPWAGEVTTKVTDVRRGEPDASLFTPPADYKVDKSGSRRVIRIETKDGEQLPPPPPPQD